MMNEYKHQTIVDSIDMQFGEPYISHVCSSMVGSISNALVEEGYFQKSRQDDPMSMKYTLQLSVVVATKEDFINIKKSYKQVNDLLQDPMLLPAHIVEKLQSIQTSLHTVLQGSEK